MGYGIRFVDWQFEAMIGEAKDSVLKESTPTGKVLSKNW